MRGLSIYLMAAVLLVLALDTIAPPVGLGFDVVAWPAVDRGATFQFVDRRHKGDRLQMPKAVGQRKNQQEPLRMMIGCDPVFSPLSAAARLNFPARCIAELAVGRPAKV